MENSQERNERVRNLLMQYGEYQSELVAIEATMKDIKSDIQKEMGDDTKMAFDNFASVQKVASSTVVSYDDKSIVGIILQAIQDNDMHSVIELVQTATAFDASKLDKLAVSALSDGQLRLSQRLTDARKESNRSGSMRITFVK